MWMVSFDHFLYVTLPMMALLGICQLWVKASFGKWSRVGNSSGVTGAQAAAGILRAAGIHDVRVERVAGHLSDHYDPRSRVVRLSPAVFDSPSIAAVGIAAHECGHAMQHAHSYGPLVIRNAAVPLASIGSTFGWIALFIGILLGGVTGEGVSVGSLGGMLIWLGVGGIAAIAAFQLINLPVEFDASRRALQVLPAMGILTERESEGARTMLTAAAMTYVAATIAAIWELVYWLMRLGILGGRDE